MMLFRDQLQRGAADGGFQMESYEKVCVLIDLLGAIRAHPFLGHRMALKGGTALNLFVLDFPRLSVDIDLNLIGASDRATMLNERPRIEQALEQVFGRLRLVVKRAPNEHAGGKVEADLYQRAREAGNSRASAAPSARGPRPRPRRDLRQARVMSAVAPGGTARTLHSRVDYQVL